ncbi:Smyd3, partial [Symbiodinium sp. CCMP2456]
GGFLLFSLVELIDFVQYFFLQYGRHAELIFSASVGWLGEDMASLHERSGSARLLAMSWPRTDFDSPNGLSQEDRDYGLPPIPDDEDYEGSWGWGWGDTMWDAPDERPEEPDADAGVTEVPETPAPPGATGSSPSHRAEVTSQAGSATRQSRTPEVPKAVDELSMADSFILEVLRGWRLMQASGLNAEERRDILASTKNSMEYSVIAAALQNLWDDQLFGRGYHAHVPHHQAYYMDPMDNHEAEYALYQENEDPWWNDADGWWYEGNYMDDHGHYGEDDWWNSEWPAYEAQALPEAEDPGHKEKLQEAQQAEQVAESLAAEATRTWAEAQRATQALRRDRGFGAVMHKGKGSGKCFNCGGNHFARDCPQPRFSGFGQGKNRAFAAETEDYWAYFSGKGKGKFRPKGKKGPWMQAHAVWNKGKSKGKPKGKDVGRSVNAYSSDMFLGGLEFSGLEAAATQTSTAMAPSSDSEAHQGMIDSGATASAAPEAVVKGLISSILTQDKGAKIEFDQSARPYFRFGNGRWGRALCRVHLSSVVSGQLRSFSLYVLPNPDEYFKSGFDKSSLVPVLVGMDCLGKNGIGILIDFATGLAMNTHEDNPEIYKLHVNKKGHYTFDIVHHLTQGHSSHEGQAHVVVRDSRDECRSLQEHQFLELGAVWFDMTVCDAELDERDLEAARCRMRRLYNASRASSASASQALMIGPGSPVATPTPSSSRSLGDVAFSADARAGDRGPHPCENQAESQGCPAGSQQERLGRSSRSKNQGLSVAMQQCSHPGTTSSQRPWPMDPLRSLQPPSGVRAAAWEPRPDYEDGQSKHDPTDASTATGSDGKLQANSGHLFGYAAKDRCGGAAQHVDSGADVRAPDGGDCDAGRDGYPYNERYDTSDGESNKSRTDILHNKLAGDGESQHPGRRLLKEEDNNKAKNAHGTTLPVFMGKKLMALTGLYAAMFSQLLINLHLSDCDGLWEISSAPHGRLSAVAEQQGLQPRRINYQNGYNLYKSSTWVLLRDLQQQRRPRRLWISLPYTRWCPWHTMPQQDAGRQEQWETDRRRERRLLWEVANFVLHVVSVDPSVMIYFEWPMACSGWQQQPMLYLKEELGKQGVPWLPCRVDGCRYDLRDVETEDFIQKKWLIKTSDEKFHQQFRTKVCPGNHRHAPDRQRESFVETYYPEKLVQSITHHWREQMCPTRHLRYLRQGDESMASAGTLESSEATEGWNLQAVEQPHEELPDEMELSMSQPAVIEINNYARELSARRKFSFDDCEKLLYFIYNYSGVNYQQQHLRWATTPAQRLQLGLYSFGAFGGITNQTQEFADVAVYLNKFIQHHLPQHSWTSMMVNFNGRARPHKDHHNVKGTSNILAGFGQYQGGGLWLQGSPTDGQEERRRQMANGSYEQGYVEPTFHRFVVFDPGQVHAAQRWQGLRIAISAYSSRMVMNSNPEEMRALRQYGFPVGSSQTPSILSAAEQTTSTTTGLKNRIVDLDSQTPSILAAEQTTSTTTGPFLETGDASSSQLPEGVSQDEVQKWTVQVAKFHRAAGHPSNRNLARIIKDAGHPEWKIEVARQFSCPTCQSVKPGGTSSGKIPPASTHAQYGAWEAVAVDSGEWVPPGRKIKVKFLLFMDVATKLRVVCPVHVYDFLEMKAESSQDFMVHFTERWLGNYPKPKVVLMDSAKSFISEATQNYMSDLNILVHFIAEKESWAHGVVEAAVQDLKMTASAIYQDIRDLQPPIALQLATAALNSTEFTAGFSAFQWAFGRQYSLTDEDVRTFANSDHQNEFTRLMTLRQDAEAVACRTRAQRVLTRLHNSTVRQPLREFDPLTLVKVWRKEEKFVYETSSGEDPMTWRTLADILPKREYYDLVDQEPQQHERELPDLPEVPDETTRVAPQRRVRAKMNPQLLEPVPEEGTHATSATSSSEPPRQPPEVNDYDQPQLKKAKAEEPSWVEELYMEANMEEQSMDIFGAMTEVNEFLKIEIDLPHMTSNRQKKMFERNPVAYLVKKMKDSEVVLSRLSPEDRKLFTRAKAKEVESFLRNEAVRKCLDDTEVKRAYESGRIVKARWVLTWKLVPPEDQEEAQRDHQSNENTMHTKDGLRNAKARIVLLGFQHPNLLDPAFKTSSPVQSTLGRNLLYQMSAQHQWPLEGLDLATAFLQTQPTEADQELWTTGVEELRQAVGVGAEEIMRILRNIYGSTTAPRGLWLDLHKTLTRLGAQPVLGERCLWIWLTKIEENYIDGKPQTIGAMGGHVDDFHRLGNGSPEWLEVKAKIDAAYKWGMTKQGSYRHAGTDVSTVTDENGYQKILVDQQYYVDGLTDVEIDADRLRSEQALGTKDIEACRTALGGLQWLAVQSQPQLCARCNLLLTEVVTSGTMATAREIQQMIGEVRRECFKLEFKKFLDVQTWDEMVFISMGDQAHNNRPKGDSTGGLITLAAGPGSLDGGVSPMVILAWRTWKLRRKAIGSNDAEVQSILEAEDHNFRTRLLWTELHGAGGHLGQRPRRTDLVELLELQAERVRGVLCTDSRGGYDAVELNESPLLGLSNMRSALQAFQLRDNLQRAGCKLRWLASDFDLADALTKKREEARQGLLKMLRTGYWSIRFDPSFTSAKKGKKQGKSALEAVDRHVLRGRPRPSHH